MTKEAVTDDMRSKLRASLPPEAVTQHPTKKYLSSISSIYVTERLNDVFGVGGWHLNVKFIEKVNDMVVVKVRFSVPKYDILVEQFGGNDNGGSEKNANFDLGDAYKGAVTDALTKIASYLEVGIDVFKNKKKIVQVKKVPISKTQSAHQQADLKPCPNCGKSFVIKNSSRGEFWACTGFPACKTTMSIDDAKNHLKSSNY